MTIAIDKTRVPAPAPAVNTDLSLSELFVDIIRDSIAQHIKIYPQNSIWASQVGHPCLRRNEYALTRWQDQLPVSVDLQEIFDEGNYQEEIITKKLMKHGFEMRRSQQPLFETVKRNGKKLRYGISGRLDTEIHHPRFGENVWITAEIKGLEPRTFESINNLSDMIHHKRYYVRMYPAQLMMYLYQMNKDTGAFVLKNKVSGKLKLIPIVIDYDTVEQLLKNAERINEVVAKIEESPEKADKYLDDRMEYDEFTCGGCTYRHICLPDVDRNATLIDDQELLEQIEKREELKPVFKAYEEVDEAVKELCKKKGMDLFVLGDFTVKVAKAPFAKYDIPENVKSKYKLADGSKTTVTIKPFTKKEK